ncbi:MAG: hypothetical protein NVS9B2_06720 [Steroidobacteraceae bacterium]
MTYPVRQDDKVVVAVQQLPAPEQHAAEVLIEEAVAGASGAVQNQDRVVDPAMRVAPRFAEDRVVRSRGAPPRTGAGRRGQRSSKGLARRCTRNPAE